jgi:hypothetical protein
MNERATTMTRGQLEVALWELYHAATESDDAVWAMINRLDMEVEFSAIGEEVRQHFVALARAITARFGA